MYVYVKSPNGKYEFADSPGVKYELRYFCHYHFCNRTIPEDEVVWLHNKPYHPKCAKIALRNEKDAPQLITEVFQIIRDVYERNKKIYDAPDTA